MQRANGVGSSWKRASNWASVRNTSLSLNILSAKKEKRGDLERKKKAL
jgi:hypothetical protein